MKKLFAVALLLCMLCTCAFAESVPTLNWSDISEETQAAGQFTQIALADDLALLCWIPSNMEAVDVSTIEAEVAPVEAYQVEGGAYTVSIYALQVPASMNIWAPICSETTRPFSAADPDAGGGTPRFSWE